MSSALIKRFDSLQIGVNDWYRKSMTSLIVGLGVFLGLIWIASIFDIRSLSFLTMFIASVALVIVYWQPMIGGVASVVEFLWPGDDPNKKSVLRTFLMLFICIMTSGSIGLLMGMLGSGIYFPPVLLMILLCISCFLLVGIANIEFWLKLIASIAAVMAISMVTLGMNPVFLERMGISTIGWGVSNVEQKLSDMKHENYMALDRKLTKELKQFDTKKSSGAMTPEDWRAAKLITQKLSQAKEDYLQAQPKEGGGGVWTTFMRLKGENFLLWLVLLGILHVPVILFLRWAWKKISNEAETLETTVLIPSSPPAAKKEEVKKAEVKKSNGTGFAVFCLLVIMGLAGWGIFSVFMAYIEDQKPKHPIPSVTYRPGISSGEAGKWVVGNYFKNLDDQLDYRTPGSAFEITPDSYITNNDVRLGIRYKGQDANMVTLIDGKCDLENFGSYRNGQPAEKQLCTGNWEGNLRQGAYAITFTKAGQLKIELYVGLLRPNHQGDIHFRLDKVS